jgi:hypothetical protein
LKTIFIFGTMEELSREIRFKCYLQSEGNNQHRKRMNFFRTIKSIKQIAYGEHIRGMVTMKAHKRELFGFNISNFKSKYICDEGE